MSADLPEAHEADVMLAEAAKADLVLMRHVQSLALAATDAQEVGTLVHAYARVSRAMRQNLALLARQKADRAKAAREAERDDARRAAQPDLKTAEEIACDERADALQAAVGRVISAASGGDRRLHADWAHRFDCELDDWREAPDFLDDSLGAQVRRACRRLGLPDDVAARWRELPEPTYFPDPLEDDAPDDAAEARAPGEPAARARFDAPAGPQRDAPGRRLPWADTS